MGKQLSTHFSERSLGAEQAPGSVVPVLQRTAMLLESVRSAVGDVPLRVTSGYRSPLDNARVGGAERSQHTDGSAVDFVPVGLSTYDFMARFLAAERAGKVDTYGQLILYPFTTGHIHISLPTRGKQGQKLVKTKEGGYVLFSLSLLKQFPLALGLVLAVVGILILSGKSTA